MIDLSKYNNGSVVISTEYKKYFFNKRGIKIINPNTWHKFQLIKNSDEYLKWEYCKICSKVRHIPDWVMKALQETQKIPVSSYDENRAKMIIRDHLDKQYEMWSKNK